MAKTPGFATMIALVHGDELARMWGYSSANNAFRDWCIKMHITPVPGRPGWYDPKLIRRRLDEAQGLLAEGQGAFAPASPMSLVEQRRARRGAA